MFFLVIDIGLFVTYTSLKDSTEVSVESKKLFLNLIKIITTILVTCFLLQTRIF
jgi:hypothetical protein